MCSDAYTITPMPQAIRKAVYSGDSTMKDSTKPTDIAQALSRLLALMRQDGAEFPDVAWRVAVCYRVDYVTLCDAYDDHCMK
jgi:hypothetical protein